MGRVRARLQSVVAVVLVIAFLKWSTVATMPVAFAAFLVALAWPLQKKLENRLPSGVSFVIAVLVLLLVVGLFVGVLWWTGQTVAERSSEYMPRLQAVNQQVQAWARAYGIELAGGSELAGRAAGAAASSVTLILLILALAILGLHEVRRFRRKSLEAFGESKGGRLIETVEAIVSKYQRYLWARTLAALIQGVTVWLFSLVMGLDFALVWGLIAFLLNYIPTIGSVVAVVPPVLFSLIQFDGLGRPLAVLLGMALLQLLCGNYADPLIQGKLLKLSPVVVLASVVFWGWVWGIPGALLGVPITIGAVIATDHFPQTRWIARLLAE
ncbi:MAG TPA: AI-2E family transporter [Thermoanaerobaculia bacterium]|nr:AI-2E family transporter [Thermoanaerobaculia bacterium]